MTVKIRARQLPIERGDVQVSGHDKGVKYEAVCETLVKISDRISTQVRTLALGVLAVLWAVWTSDSAATRTIGVHLRSHAVGIACVAVLTLLADFGQYAFGYRVSLDLRKKMEGEQLDSAEYDYSAPNQHMLYLFAAHL